MKTVTKKSLLATAILMCLISTAQPAYSMEFLSSWRRNISSSIQNFSQNQLYNALSTQNLLSKYRVKALLSLGVRPVQTTDKNYYILFENAINAQRIDTLEMMLQNGIDPNTRHMITGDTPLHYALLHNNESTEKICTLLIKYGANLAAKNGLGNTPLHTALLNTKDLDGNPRGTFKEKASFWLNIVRPMCFGPHFNATEIVEKILHPYIQQLLEARDKQRTVPMSDYTSDSLGTMKQTPEEVILSNILKFTDSRDLTALTKTSKGARSLALNTDLDINYIINELNTLLEIKNNNDKTVADLTQDKTIFSKANIEKQVTRLVKK